jgi:DNA-nicking Smr family endonuclease
MTRRRLSDDERVLWKGVTRSIEPLRKPTAASDAEPAAPTAGPKSPAKVRAKPVPAASVAPSKPSGPPPLEPLSRRGRQRIVRGRQEIDGRLDLHGMTQAEAHDALFSFLRSRQARGGRLVLVITGKGSPGGEGRGVLKRMVPLWLEMPEFRSIIIGFDRAGPGHGGDGALYVSLRKSR